MTTCTERYALIAAEMLARATDHPDKLERIANGLALAVNGNVHPQGGPCAYSVSSLDGTHVYDVGKNAQDSWACTCPDFTKRSACCKHLAAVAIVHRAAKHYTYTADDGATVLLGHKATADAQRAADEAAGGLARLACDRQHRSGAPL